MQSIFWIESYMHTAKMAGGVKKFRGCGAKFQKYPKNRQKIGKISKKSGKIAKARRFSVFFTLKPKNFQNF